MTPPRYGSLVLIVTVGLFGCVPGRTVVDPLGEAETVLDGQIVFPRSSPGPGGASPAPTPTVPPDPGTYTPFAVHVAVTSDHPDLNVAPPPGKGATYRSTTYVSAQVTMSNGYRNHEVTWSSSRPDLIHVDAFGTVTAVGSQAGWTEITATSADGKASGSLRLQLTNYGDAEVIVD